MQSLRNFIRRNAPVFFFGLAIAVIFLLIILTQPNPKNSVPAGFKKVEETIFEDRESKEPEETIKTPEEYASQSPSIENKGKPYFYGESNPNLRDSEGYPTPPLPESVLIPNSLSSEQKLGLKNTAIETYNKRTTTVVIKFTDKGFEPKDAAGYTGQKIQWINNSNKQIIITQTLPIHEALKNGLVIDPSKSVEFRPLVNGLFTYLDPGTGFYATLSIEDVTTSIQ